ncbi:MAG: efflux RND transporter permease subunit [Candidatus Xenobiia bacterium LiM19]
MTTLIKTAIRYRSLTMFAVFLIMAVGIFSYMQLPQNEDPPITPGMMKIFTYWPGATPEDVETYISKPLEKAISKYSHIRYQNSESLSGISIITVRFSDDVSGMDVDIGYQKIRNHIGDIRSQLPEDMIGPVIMDRIAETEAYIIGLTSESGRQSYRELQVMLENIRDELKSVNGAGDCQFYGSRTEKIYIELSTEDLKGLGIHPGQIIEGIRSRNIRMAEPYINLSGNQLFIEVTGAYKSVEQIRDSTIYSDPSGHAYRLKDLKGKIYHSYDDPPQWMARVNRHKSLLLTVSMKRGFHIVRWGSAMDRKISEIQAKMPSDIKLTILFNQPEEVKRSVNGFMKNFYEAIILVVVILGIGLGFRNAGIVALAIPLIICATFAAMNVFRIELHQMSISALIIVLGLIVDNSVVVIDNIDRYMHEGLSRAEAALKGAVEVAPALFTGTAAISTVFAALAFMPGSAGEYIIALPSVICIALPVSYFAALLVSPTLASILSKSREKGKAAEENRKAAQEKGKAAEENGKAAEENGKATDGREKEPGTMQKIYGRFVDITQKHKALSLMLVALMFFSSLYLTAKYIPLSFFPTADKSQFVVHVFLPEGSDIHATEKKVAQLEKKLEEMKRTVTAGNGGLLHKSEGKPLVNNYIAYIGQPGPRFYISLFPRPPQTRYAHIMVTTPGGRQTKEAAQELEKYIKAHITGARINVLLLELGPTVEYPVEVRITGRDTETLRKIAARCEDILSKIEGVISINNDYGADSKKIVVRVDQDRAAMLGVSSQDIISTLYMGFQGYPVSRLNAPERPIDIVLRLEKDKRRNIDDLKAVLLTSRTTGQKHRLDECAQVCLDSYSSAICRRNEHRTLTLGVHVKGALPSEIQKRIEPELAKIEMPSGYSISYGGQQEESDMSTGQLLPLVLLGVVLMFLIIAFKFKSIRIALAIYMSIPTAFMGAMGGLFIMKQSLGFMAIIGLASLFGVVVYNAIVMVQFIHDRLKSGRDIIEAIKEGGYLRIRPILMTAACAIGGLLPLALSGNPLFEAMCWVIIFGLAFSTVMTLLMTPLYYVAFGGVAGSLRVIEVERAEAEGGDEADSSPVKNV